MNILVTHGSERGGTAGIAARIGETLRGAGITVDVLPAREVRDVGRYDAVLVGGALYAVRWHADARRFVIRHAEALRARPVWFFSSGPLDGSAREAEIPPTVHVQQLMDLVGASGHATFGGRLAPDAQGFIASSMAKTRAGDWRDDAQIDAWARRVARHIEAELARPEPREARRPFKPLPSRAVPLALCLAAGVSAVFGGAALTLRPDGSMIGLPLSVLQHAPFHDFLVPGLLLLVVVGLGNVWAACLHALRSDMASLVSFISGNALMVWMVVEMAMLRSAQWLQVTCLLLGVAIVAGSIHQVRLMMPPVTGAPRTPAHG
jgi:menaquinone-dependent protoporphyrinogen oxidase